MSYEIVSNVVLFLLGIIFSVLIYYSQERKAQKVAKLRESQLLAQINRAQALMIPNEVIEKIVKDDSQESKETLRQWLWGMHKGACDAYVNAVSYYLSFQDKFTQKDLDTVKAWGMITEGWEEHVWRSLIGLRQENRLSQNLAKNFSYDRKGMTVDLSGSTSQPPIAVIPDQEHRNSIAKHERK